MEKFHWITVESFSIKINVKIFNGTLKAGGLEDDEENWKENFHFDYGQPKFLILFQDAFVEW